MPLSTIAIVSRREKSKTRRKVVRISNSRFRPLAEAFSGILQVLPCKISTSSFGSKGIPGIFRRLTELNEPSRTSCKLRFQWRMLLLPCLWVLLLVDLVLSFFEHFSQSKPEGSLAFHYSPSWKFFWIRSLNKIKEVTAFRLFVRKGSM